MGVEGLELTADERRFIHKAQPGGFILFARNLESPAQTNELLRALQSLVDEPCFFSIDQEGGRVDRLKKYMPPLPAMLKTAGKGPTAVREHARLSARVLSEIGFNMNFAPVLDLFSPFKNGIEDRCFDSDPAKVAKLGRAYLTETAKHGVPGTLKHFPGLGRGECDSHADLPFILIKRERMEEEDLLPFRANMDSSPFVMVAHAFYPDYEENDDRPIPASMSRNIVTRLLRKELGFKGLAMTDDLLMGALRGFGEMPELCEQALVAGEDLLLICRNLAQEELIYKFLTRSKSGAVARRQAESLARVKRVKRSLAMRPNVEPCSPARIAKLSEQLRIFGETINGGR